MSTLSGLVHAGLIPPERTFTGVLTSSAAFSVAHLDPGCCLASGGDPHNWSAADLTSAAAPPNLVAPALCHRCTRTAAHLCPDLALPEEADPALVWLGEAYRPRHCDPVDRARLIRALLGTQPEAECPAEVAAAAKKAARALEKELLGILSSSAYLAAAEEHLTFSRRRMYEVYNDPECPDWVREPLWQFAPVGGLNAQQVWVSWAWRYSDRHSAALGLATYFDPALPTVIKIPAAALLCRTSTPMRLLSTADQLSMPEAHQAVELAELAGYPDGADLRQVMGALLPDSDGKSEEPS